MKLVICEKPSVGAAVAAALGVREKKDGFIDETYLALYALQHRGTLGARNIPTEQ